MRDTQQLVDGLLSGNRRMLAKILTIIENQLPEAEQVQKALFPHTGNAWIVGITGAPGTGKSTLVNAIIKELRSQDKTVGVIAVDPTSPFSGGAILGDRIRISDHVGDSGVFVRSMATRGMLGGLAEQTQDLVRVFDAAGFDIIIIETVGAGQSEIEIVRTAHTVLVVEAPGLGDDVQAIKAGILEIADVLVVNKADQPGARRTVASLKMMLELGHPVNKSTTMSHHGQQIEVEIADEPDSTELWIPPVVMTEALNHVGIREIIEQIEAHRHYLHQTGNLIQYEKEQLEAELTRRLQDAILEITLKQIPDTKLDGTIKQIQERKIDPQSAVNDLLKIILPLH